MARRLWSAAVILVMLGAPLAPAVCRITCASHDRGIAIERSEHHSCHSQPADGTTVNPVAHQCGHQNASFLSLLQALQVLDPPAAIEAPPTTFVGSDLTRTATRPLARLTRPPDPVSLSRPLRI